MFLNSRSGENAIFLQNPVLWVMAKCRNIDVRLSISKYVSNKCGYTLVLLAGLYLEVGYFASRYKRGEVARSVECPAWQADPRVRLIFSWKNNFHLFENCY